MAVQAYKYDIPFGITAAAVQKLLASASVTFTDTGDTVGYSAHPYADGDRIRFTVITTTTGVSTGTYYYVVAATTNTFQVASTLGGAALPLTTNGTGTAIGYKEIVLEMPNKVSSTNQVDEVTYKGRNIQIQRKQLVSATLTIDEDCFPVGAHAAIFGLTEATSGLPDSYTSAYPLFTTAESSGLSTGFWVEGTDTQYSATGTNSTKTKRYWCPSGVLTAIAAPSRETSGKPGNLWQYSFIPDMTPTTDITGLALPTNTSGGPFVVMDK